MVKETFVSKDKTRYMLEINTRCLFINNDHQAFISNGRYWKYMKANFDSLGKLKKDINRCGGKMAMVWAPSRERVCFPLLSRERYMEIVMYISRKIDGYEASLSRFARSKNILFLDLAPELVRLAKQGMRLYFRKDGHLNSRGTRWLVKSSRTFFVLTCLTDASVWQESHESDDQA